MWIEAQKAVTARVYFVVGREASLQRCREGDRLERRTRRPHALRREVKAGVTKLRTGNDRSHGAARVVDDDHRRRIRARWEYVCCERGVILETAVERCVDPQPAFEHVLVTLGRRFTELWIVEQLSFDLFDKRIRCHIDRCDDGMGGQGFVS